MATEGSASIDTEPLAAASAAAPGEERPVDKIIVAIHGIGSQSRSSTIRNVASRFGDRSVPPLPMMPLGYFNVGNETEVRISYLDPVDREDPLRRIGFAEIFWADIPKAVVKQDDLLEETRAWGRTVVSRAQSTYAQTIEAKYKKAGENRKNDGKNRKKDGKERTEPKLHSDDFAMSIGVVDEIVETIGVIENLLVIADKAGLFKFDLAPLLRDYVGDVQLVADFPFQRDKILYRFHSALGKIVDAFVAHNLKNKGTTRPEIYFVAHSEGTVISFLGMLEAFIGKPVEDPEKKDAQRYDSRNWIGDVRGYMTIGSPIDKHILLWPALWKEFAHTVDRNLLLGEKKAKTSHWSKLKTQPGKEEGSIVFTGNGELGATLGQKIKWRNYYDYGDPIGFQLDTAVEFLCEHECAAFEFVTKDHDIGFSRYLLPGKAHNDYWTDGDVFAHFIDAVVLPPSDRPPAKVPQSSRIRGAVSTAIPYLLTFLIHLAAVFALYKGITALVPGTKFAHLPLQLSLLSALLFCMTAAARLPRLVKTDGWRWHGVALVVFGAGAWCIWVLPDASASFLANPFRVVLERWMPGLGVTTHSHGIKVLLIAICFAVTSTGWWVGRKPNRGRWTLLGVGSAAIGYIVLDRLLGGDTANPTWPMLLAGLAFLYLWWLGILLFDLTFVWHRYIRNSVAIDTLRQWRRGAEATPRSPKNFWKRPYPPRTQAP